MVKCGPWQPKNCGFADVVADHRFSHLDGFNAVPSLQYQSGRRIVMHSATVRQPDSVVGGGQLYLPKRWTLTNGPRPQEPGGQDP